MLFGDKNGGAVSKLRPSLDTSLGTFPRLPGNRPVTATAREWLESPHLAIVVQRAARQHGLSDDDLGELLQDVRIGLWQQGLDLPLTPAWVFRVAFFKVVDLLRRRVRERRRQQLSAVDQPATGDREIEHLLHVEAAALPRHLRTFYDLHYRLGLSEREIARRLGVCRASVRWLDRCCRRKLAGDATVATFRPNVHP